MSDYPLLKDYVNPEMIAEFARRITDVYPEFDGEAFQAQINPKLPSLELKERTAAIAAGLRDHLPQAYPKAVDILLKILDWGPAARDKFQSFQIMPIAHFVEAYGLDHFEVSMQANYQITQRWTAEFSIRPFIVQYPEQTWALLEQWVHDDSEHVRRLVSEGTRPRLPWAGRLHQFIDDPEPLFPLLETLKDDPSEYVRKSVANNLNDISKDHPARVIAVLREWSQDATDGTRWIIRHALRTLIKAGDPDALSLLGYDAADISLTSIHLSTDAIQLGEAVDLSFELKNDGDQPANLMIDTVVHFVKKTGTTSPKVFKLTKASLEPGETFATSKTIKFLPINTRKHYSGQHRIEVQVNGQILGGADFMLTV